MLHMYVIVEMTWCSKRRQALRDVHCLRLGGRLKNQEEISVVSGAFFPPSECLAAAAALCEPTIHQQTRVKVSIVYSINVSYLWIKLNNKLMRLTHH